MGNIARMEPVTGRQGEHARHRPPPAARRRGDHPHPRRGGTDERLPPLSRPLRGRRLQPQPALHPAAAGEGAAHPGRRGHGPGGHDGRALRNILDTWPRDELFQAPEEAILAGCLRALDLQIRPRAALVLRRDPFERFVSAIAWLPRDTFDTAMRERIGGLIARAFNGRLSAFYTLLGDAPLARVHYVIGTTPGAVPAVEDGALEAAIVQAARGFRDRLEEALVAEAGEAGAARLLARWREAFPATYRQSETVAQGIADLHLAERAIAAGRPRVHLCRPPGAGPRALTLRLASPDRPLPLSDALPLFESLDLRAIEEVPYRIEPAGGPAVVLHAYRLDARADAAEEVFPALTGALSALLDGAAEADGFNRLVLRAGLRLARMLGCCARCTAG
jgi:glutamate dehydrogenase